MKGFEPAFDLVRGFHFETPQDRENALWLFTWMTIAKDAALKGLTFKPPLVLISGPPCSGKTTLVKRVAEMVGIEAFPMGRYTPRSLWLASKAASPLIWYDCVKLPTRGEPLDSLCMYLTSVSYTAMDGDKVTSIGVLNKLVVFTAVPFGNQTVSADLQRRLVRIRLLPSLAEMSRATLTASKTRA